MGQAMGPVSVAKMGGIGVGTGMLGTVGNTHPPNVMSPPNVMLGQAIPGGASGFQGGPSMMPCQCGIVVPICGACGLGYLQRADLAGRSGYQVSSIYPAQCQPDQVQAGASGIAESSGGMAAHLISMMENESASYDIGSTVVEAPKLPCWCGIITPTCSTCGMGYEQRRGF